MQTEETLDQQRHERLLTGDLVAKLRDSAHILVDSHPASVDAFALWSALVDIEEMFGGDDQGIGTAEAERINRSLIVGINALVEAGYLSRCEVPPTEIVSPVIAGLAELRAAQL